jgi:hypothetical protein
MDQTLRNYLMALAVAGGTALAGSLSASAAESTRDIGYVDASEDIYYATGWSFDKEYRVGVGIKIPASMISSYAGSQIVAIKTAWGSKNSSTDAEFFVREGSFNSENVASGSGTLTYSTSCTEYKLDEPYIIQPDTDVFIGYYANVPANDYCVYTSTYGGGKEDTSFMCNATLDAADGVAEQWGDLFGEDQFAGPLFMLAVVQVGDVTQYVDMLELNAVVARNIAELGSTRNAVMDFTNSGQNAVKSLELTFTNGEKSESKTVTLSSAIAAGKSVSKMAMPFVMLGSGETTVTVTKVNGNDNKASELSTSQVVKTVAVPDGVADAYVKRPIVDYFVSESEYRSPQYYDLILAPGLNPYRNRISLVCHHMNDQFMMGDDEDTQLALDMADGNKTRVYIPAMTVDRNVPLDLPAIWQAGSMTYGTVSEMFAPTIYDEFLALPTFAAVNVNVDYNEDTRSGSVIVSGDIAEDVLPADENLYLTVYVTEDNVESDAQEMQDNDTADTLYPDGIYHHPALIRMQPTDIYGVEIKENNYSYSFNFSLDDETWKPADMKVVALLQRPQSNGVYERDVVNCAEAPLIVTGIKEVFAADGSHSTVEFANGTITVNGSTAGVTVYTTSGMSVANANLPAGLYIVSTNSFTTKLLVK